MHIVSRQRKTRKKIENAYFAKQSFSSYSVRKMKVFLSAYLMLAKKRALRFY